MLRRLPVLSLRLNQCANFRSGALKPRPSGIDVVHQMPIDHHEAHQAREIVAVPVAVHIGLAGTQCSAEHHIGIEPRAVHTDGDVEGRGCR